MQARCEPVEPTGRLAILATRSAARQRMLLESGVQVEIVPADIDESAIALPRSGGGARGRAVATARAKAAAISHRFPDRIIIGADQVLESPSGHCLAKPASVAHARARLLALRRHWHMLHSAYAILRSGKPLCGGTGTACVQFRDFSEAFLDDYIANACSDLTECTGGYRIEGRGIQLIEQVAGCHFTILGLPLIPLLADLRQLGLLAR